jgi:hypothetical protein
MTGQRVALHTQALQAASATQYLAQLRLALRAARLSRAFPERRELDAALVGLAAGLEFGVYGDLWIDSRAGLPNLAAWGRVAADAAVARDGAAEFGLEGLDAGFAAAIQAKRDYRQALLGLPLAPLERRQVLLRHHDPATSTAAFRVEQTKLTGQGLLVRLVIELTQMGSAWSRRAIELDATGDVATGTETFTALVYKFATHDAETLFLRLAELPGVTVERVSKGVIGPVLFAWPAAAAGDGAAPSAASVWAQPEETAQLGDGARELAALWRAWVQQARPAAPVLLASFATDMAAPDIRDERSNDPLARLFSAHIRDGERARYAALRARAPFRVFKDRKFAGHAACLPVVDALMAGAATRNLVYRLD